MITRDQRRLVALNAKNKPHDRVGVALRLQSESAKDETESHEIYRRAVRG
jgi:hypothetical protein